MPHQRLNDKNLKMVIFMLTNIEWMTSIWPNKYLIQDKLKLNMSMNIWFIFWLQSISILIVFLVFMTFRWRRTSQTISDIFIIIFLAIVVEMDHFIDFIIGSMRFRWLICLIDCIIDDERSIRTTNEIENRFFCNFSYFFLSFIRYRLRFTVSYKFACDRICGKDIFLIICFSLIFLFPF